MKVKKGSNTVQRIYEIAQPIADELGLMLWDIRFEKEGANWYLRVFIDKEEGIEIEDCEAISRPLNTILDETDPIEQAYVFEVCSPGLGRELRRDEHFQRFIGDEIKIRFIREKDGIKELTGNLVSYSKDTVIVSTESGEQEIILSDCAYIKLNDDKDLF